MTLSASNGKAGDLVDYVLENTGAADLEFGSAYVWQRQESDGSWVQAHPDRMFTAELHRLEPGASRTMRATVDEALEPGTYRFVKRVGCGSGTDLVLTAPFEVVA